VPWGPRTRRRAARITAGGMEGAAPRQHTREIVEQVPRSRVAMRLEHEHDPPPRPSLANRFERRRDFRRVMSVVIDERDTTGARLHIAILLESPIDAVEARERRLNRLIGDLQLRTHG